GMHSNQGEVAVEGTILCPYSLDNTQGEFFLDDNGSGIKVIFEEQNLAFPEGQKLLVCGRYVEDRTRPTLLATEVYPAGTGRTVSLRPNSIRTIIDNVRKFEGTLVILRNVRKIRVPASPWPPTRAGSTRYYLTDGEGRDSILLSVHPSSGLLETPEPKYPLTLRGIITHTNGESAPVGQVVILPRSPSDINPVLTPASPEARSPADGAKNLSLSPTLEWDLGDDASHYHLQVSTDSAFSSMVAEDSLLTESTYHCPQLASEAVLFWRVRAFNADGPGPFSERRRFSTIAHPTVRIFDPEAGTPLATSSVIVRVARSGFWYGGEKDAPDELFENQSGFLKISVRGVTQRVVDRDSLWVVRLAHGENVVTAELVDHEGRSLHPPVIDSTVLTVSGDAWVVRAYTADADASSPVLHNSSSLSLRPLIAQEKLPDDGSSMPPLEVTVDGRSTTQASAGIVSVTG
ncbi:MAG: hypothetical protein IH628_13135, partial [Proteobacteria bacterium]|nr:hypothetical protein [Pseudomonadota bacterium]